MRRVRVLRPLWTLRFAAILITRLLFFRPHLVHLHTSDYTSFWEKAALAEIVRFGAIPLVLHLHGGHLERFLKGLGGFQAQLAARTLRGATCIVVPGQTSRSFLSAHLGRAHVVAVPNAIRVEDFDPLARERQESWNPTREGSPIRILFLGNMSRDKGLEDLLQATRELARTQSETFEVHVVGGEATPGAFRYYTKLFAQAGLGKHVQVHGPADGPERLAHLRAAQIFVLPSRQESFGIANLEAMASGLPIISTRTGAIPEYVTDGVEGLLVGPGDVGGLTRALERLVSDPLLRRRLGQAGRRRVRAYDWDAGARRLGLLYESILDPKASLT